MAQSPEVQAQIAEWRRKAREGTLTQDEMRAAIAVLRESRVGAAAVSAKAKATKSAATAKKNINSDDLLGELEGL